MAKHWEQNKDATVYVGNIDERFSQELLAELMTQMGPIRQVHMPQDRVSQTHQGYGFVEFDTAVSAEYAAKVLNGIRVWGKPVRVNKASADKQKTVDIGAELFINGLDLQVDEKILYDTFSQFGAILRQPNVVRDENNVSKGYGFVSFDSFEASDVAREAMNGQYLLSKAVTVEYAYKKDGKGERHGDEAERTLAAEGKKHNILPERQVLPAAYHMTAASHTNAAPPTGPAAHNNNHNINNINIPTGPAAAAGGPPPTAPTGPASASGPMPSPYGNHNHNHNHMPHTPGGPMPSPMTPMTPGGPMMPPSMNSPYGGGGMHSGPGGPYGGRGGGGGGGGGPPPFAGGPPPFAGGPPPFAGGPLPFAGGRPPPVIPIGLPPAPSGLPARPPPSQVSFGGFRGPPGGGAGVVAPPGAVGPPVPGGYLGMQAPPAGFPGPAMQTPPGGLVPPPGAALPPGFMPPPGGGPPMPSGGGAGAGVPNGYGRR